jgi:hypothetical protein
MNWTDKRGDPSPLSWANTGGRKRGKAMKKKKDGGEKIPLTWNGPRFLVLKADVMFDLGVRLGLCEKALHDCDDMPDKMKARDFSKIIKETAKAAVNENKKEVVPKGPEGLEKLFRQIGLTVESTPTIITEGLRCSISEKDSLKKLGPCCMIISMLYYYSCYNFDAGTMDRLITAVVWLDHVITEKSHEAIGYWTAKMERKKRPTGGGAKAMAERGKANKEAIKTVIAELGVRQLSVFRQDKKLRESFYDKAKIATYHGAPLSEDRISKIARALLQG